MENIVTFYDFLIFKISDDKMRNYDNYDKYYLPIISYEGPYDHHMRIKKEKSEYLDEKLMFMSTEDRMLSIISIIDIFNFLQKNKLCLPSMNVRLFGICADKNIRLRHLDNLVDWSNPFNVYKKFFNNENCPYEYFYGATNLMKNRTEIWSRSVYDDLENNSAMLNIKGYFNEPYLYKNIFDVMASKFNSFCCGAILYKILKIKQEPEKRLVRVVMNMLHPDPLKRIDFSDAFYIIYKMTQEIIRDTCSDEDSSSSSSSSSSFSSSSSSSVSTPPTPRAISLYP